MHFFLSVQLSLSLHLAVKFKQKIHYNQLRFFIDSPEWLLASFFWLISFKDLSVSSFLSTYNLNTGCVCVCVCVCVRVCVYSAITLSVTINYLNG